jgi:hypothetical protein
VAQQTVIIVSAMPTAVFTTILATEFRAEPRIVTAPPSLHHANGSLHLRVSPNELQEDHIVREMGDPVIGEAGYPEQLDGLIRHECAHTPARESLQQRVHVLSEPHLVLGGGLEIPEAIDHQASGAGPLDPLEKLVHPLVEVEVDRRPVHHLDERILEAPPESPCDPVELRGVLLERGDHSRFLRPEAGEDEMEAHQGLPGPRGAGHQGGCPGEVAVLQHVVEDRDPRGHPVDLHLVRNLLRAIGQSGEHLDALTREPVGVLP